MSSLSSSSIRSFFQANLPSSTKKIRFSTDYKLCIFCQSKNKLSLVNPLNLEKVMRCLKLREEWLDPEYKHISSRLSSLNEQQLQDFNAKWHKECYKKLTHTANMNQSKTHFEERKRCELKGNLEATTSKHKAAYPLRSKIPEYNKNDCFFVIKVRKAKRDRHCIA